MATSLTFHGAAGTVTGSKFLLEHGRRRMLVDCGLYQGEREWRRLNWAPVPFLPSGVSDVLLTHAHLDHCGYLPALVRKGFTGPAWATRGTAELAAIVLRDSAHLQEEDAEYARRGGYSRHDPPLPLYTEADAERAIRALHTRGFGELEPLGDGVAFTSTGPVTSSGRPRCCSSWGVRACCSPGTSAARSTTCSCPGRTPRRPAPS
jgi:metallo-beta-lactamase family protein